MVAVLFVPDPAQVSHHHFPRAPRFQGNCSAAANYLEPNCLGIGKPNSDAVLSRDIKLVRRLKILLIPALPAGFKKDFIAEKAVALKHRLKRKRIGVGG